ncbi:cytochrome c3 family protein [Trichloromonas acetexigens]|uniref:Cytochrome c3 family protein n=1 Tax=Trichloromonas acetexigens TaxID=38815 RepID=A0A550J9B4_9BACT|nr:cytochrome c3 family protein [Desulfuromonas acetexigens]TRO79781.1 cytochrome c3 family protein [Desulfuromonas acetexigens]
MRIFMLLVAAGLTLFATQSLAIVTIKNTKHDLSTGSTTTLKAENTDYDEICVFCHTPHKALPHDNAPLWNRSLSVDSIDDITNYYNSATIESYTKETNVDDIIVASDAPLCLSCHDGSSLTDALQNPPNTTTGQAAVTTFTATMVATANIGTDLHDDHPIGMVYNSVVKVDSGFHADGTDANGKPVVGTLPLYGSGVMWCSSCHDVHDNDHEPFLAADNTGSALCLTCHNK